VPDQLRVLAIYCITIQVKQTEFFKFWVPDERRLGKKRLTAYRMTREQAAERFPGAEPDLRTLEVRSLPETPDEALGSTHTGRGRPQGS
jgi:hypothetical protein